MATRNSAFYYSMMFGILLACGDKPDEQTTDTEENEETGLEDTGSERDAIIKVVELITYNKTHDTDGQMLMVFVSDSAVDEVSILLTEDSEEPRVEAHGTEHDGGERWDVWLVAPEHTPDDHYYWENTDFSFNDDTRARLLHRFEAHSQGVVADCVYVAGWEVSDTSAVDVDCRQVDFEPPT